MASLKQHIKRQLEEGVHLREIKGELIRKGYGINEINKAARDVIAGDNKINVKAFVILLVVIGVVVGVYFMYGYKPVGEIPTPQTESTVNLVDELCQQYPKVEEDVSCKEAVNLVLSEYPREITNILSTNGKELDLGPSLHNQSFWKMKLTLSEPINYHDDLIKGDIEVVVNKDTKRIRLYKYTTA